MLVGLLSVSLISRLYASEIKGDSIPVDGTIRLENMHLWRGQEVTSAATLTTDISITDRSDIFRFGIWGGAGVNGNYKEIDYYTNCSVSGFVFALWDIYNFSPGATYNNHQAFNYNAHETGHFVDASLTYRLQGTVPLKFYWSTIVFGRDRNLLNKSNRYSSYVEINDQFCAARNTNIEIGVAGAFALNEGRNATGERSAAHFYGNNPGIVAIHLTVSKQLNLGGHKLPVAVMTMWNPESNYANIQLTVDLISF